MSKNFQFLLNNAINYKDNLSAKTDIKFIQANDTFTPCYNCFLTSSGESTSYYNTDTGDTPFNNGSTCPVCDGTGEISDLTTKEVPCTFRRITNEFIRNRFGLSSRVEIALFVKISEFSDFDIDRPITVRFTEGDFTVSEVLKSSFYSDMYTIGLSRG